jgi:hypothetical protein
MPTLQFRRPLVVCVTAMAMSAGCDGTPDYDSSAESIVRTFLERLDRHEVEGALALLDDGFVFRSVDGGFSADRDALPAMLSWDEVADGEVRIETLERRGDVVEARLMETNYFTRTLGLSGWVVEARFRVQNGRITEEVVSEITADGPTFDQRFARALAPVREWATNARPGVADSVFAGGHIARYDAPTARRLRDLVDAYCEQEGAPTTRCQETERLPKATERP